VDYTLIIIIIIIIHHQRQLGPLVIHQLEI